MSKVIKYKIEVNDKDLKQLDKDLNNLGSDSDAGERIADDLKKASKEADKLAKSVDKADKETKELAKGSKKAGAGFKSMGKAGSTAFKSMGVALKASGIGLVVGIFMLIKKAIYSTEEGANSFGVLMSGIGQVLANLTTVVSNTLIPILDALNKAFSNASKGADSLTSKARKLTKEEQTLVRAKRALLLIDAELNTQAKESLALTKDQTKSLEEREAALESYIKLERQRSLTSKNILDNEISLMKKRMALSGSKGTEEDDYNNLLIARERLNANLADRERDYHLRIVEFVSKKAKLLADEQKAKDVAAKKDKKRRDAEIKATDELIDAMEDEIDAYFDAEEANDSELDSFIENEDKKREAAEETLRRKQELNDRYDDFLVRNVNSNLENLKLAYAVEVQLAKDAKRDISAVDEVYAKKKKDIILAGVKTELSISANMLGALSAMQDSETKAGFETSKKLRIAQATMSSAAAMMSIWEASTILPDPFGAIWKGAQTAVVGGIMLKQLNSIRSTTFGGGGGSSSGGGGSTPLPNISNSAPVVSGRAISEADRQSSATRAYVVQSDLQISNKEAQNTQDSVSI